MKRWWPRLQARVAAGAAILVLAGWPAQAQDALKIAIGQVDNWENQAPTLGVDAGLFRKHGLNVEAVAAQSPGAALQAVISGQVDLGAGVDVGLAMRAFARGAPVRLLLPSFTGAGDLYWYVKADSPIRSLKDAKPESTIAYSVGGARSHNIVTAFVQELGIRAKPTATGGPPGTLTAVMSGQVDVGWAAPPFGLREVKDGKIRIVARGNDVPSLRGQTARAIVVNADALKDRSDAIMRFVKAYREAVDWMYADPKAAAAYAAKIKVDETLVRQAIRDYQPRSALQTDKMENVDAVMREALKLKLLDAPLSREQVGDFIRIPAR